MKIKIDNLLQKINIISAININSKIFLTSFLISNFTNDLLGKKLDRSYFDNSIEEWSKKMVENFMNILDQKSYFQIKRFSIFMNNYNNIFNKWKEYDKNNTIQNIIVSYYNRKKHIEYIKNSPQNDTKLILGLESTCEKLLTNILIIDNTFDIEYLKKNYEQVYKKINLGMEEITKKITDNFKKIYIDMLVDELNEGENNMIFQLINDTNKRIINLKNHNERNEIRKKLDKFDFVNILLENKWTNELLNYLEFITNQFDNNIGWKNNVHALLKKKYSDNFPRILVQINQELDKLKL